MKHKQNVTRILSLFSLVVLSHLSLPSPANAQSGMSPSSMGAAGLNAGRPGPYQQRLSPYLDLLRTDNSVLGPYHSFVRPRQQLQQSIQTQGTQIGRLQQTLQHPLRTTTAPPTRLQTGRGGTFNNHLHFYPTHPTR